MTIIEKQKAMDDTKNTAVKGCALAIGNTITKRCAADNPQSLNMMLNIGCRLISRQRLNN